MGTLRHNLREFLFGNFQIGFKSQGLLYKVSCMELGTPHETQPYLFSQTKIQVWEWGRERFWEEEDRWNPIYKPMLSVWCYTLYPCLSFFSLLSVFALCVCNCSLFCVSAFFFLSLFLLFSCAWLSLFIEKFQRNCSLIFSQLINSWSSLHQFFSPQLLILCSAVPHYFHFSNSWQVTPLLLRCGVL